jgi:AAA domain
MILRRIEADGFLSFGGRIDLQLDRGLTVITGPNGSGKSNLVRCLDLARVVVDRLQGSEPAAERLALYADAGYEGANSFTVRISLDLDEEWERSLVWSFVCASYAHGSLHMGDHSPADDVRIRADLKKETVAPLYSGSLVVHRPAVSTQPLSAAWEFVSDEKMWNVSLRDDRSILSPGPAGTEVRGYTSFSSWLRVGRQEDHRLDLRMALKLEDGATDFSAEYRRTGMTESLQALTSILEVDPDGNAYGFDQILSVILRRGLVLTDNRRLPLRRHFTLEELGRPVDLQDGAAVGAELYRLKNGYETERKRFEEIRSTFKILTGRDLDVRSRPASLEDGSAEMIIEPTVAGLHGERLVQLSGAGIEEALLTAVLLHGEAGRVMVLDEPAVNLEPTVQRRLIGRLRGPGQHLVITHSADLVPVDEADDLARIVRIAPGRSGSEVQRWQSSELSRGDLFRQLTLMEPSHVRGLLFSRAVILCEGATEVGALPRWWRKSSTIGLPDPESANIPVISVDGDGGFGAYVRYLDAFKVPWAIIADGPSLRAGSKLARQLRRLGRCDGQPDEREDFGRTRDFWEKRGVYTLADRFGDDGSKSAEFEAYLERVDKTLMLQVQMDVGKHKPRVGACFADSFPEPPGEVLELYKKIALRFGIHVVAE